MRALLGLFAARVLWLLPTLFVVSVLAFWAISAAQVEGDPERDRLERDTQAILAREREQHLDLPRFFNASPRDVRDRSLAAAQQVASGDASGRAGQELVRLGGAALPHVLPRLDAFDPEERLRVALSLAPIAVRMDLAQSAAYADPARSVLLWQRFWNDRSVEFREAQVRTAVGRLARYGDNARARELRVLDTFALTAVMEQLAVPTDSASLEVTRSMTDFLAHTTGHPDRLAADAGKDEARAVVLRWRTYWQTHESDFVTYDGPSRAAAMVRETRYGKWVALTVLRAEIEPFSESVFARLLRDAKVTLRVLFGGIALAYLIGIPFGLWLGLRDRRRLDLPVFGLMVALFAVPPAVVAALLLLATPSAPRLFAASLTVALSVLVFPARQLRARIGELHMEPYLVAAQARGASQRSLAIRAMRHSGGLLVALLSMEPQAALAAALVAERVFGLDGVSSSLASAVTTEDKSYLMLLILLSAVVASLLIFVSDLVSTSFHPRLRGRLLERRR